MNYLSIIERTIEQQRERITAVSDKIWEFAEVRYEEAQSAELMALALEDNGFQVTRKAGGIDTAFCRRLRQRRTGHCFSRRV
ncbi:hypothetical protein LNO10_26525 [Klebsiella variicola subsp. variicola]|nr:hypothetical protein [Klebsiella variicola subsp. variicola]